MNEFILNPHTPIRIIGEISLPVRNALRDFEKDWYKVFSYPLLHITDFSGENFDNEILLDIDYKLNTGFESYSIKISGKQIVIRGADTRGIIFGIYRFSRDILGVDPLWYFNDFLPDKKTEIILPKNFSIEERSPSFKYRGWFINDEDILGGFYHNETFDGVMSPEGFNVILEALLRLGGNMIVPGSFAMPDEDVRKLVAARGVLLNDHHVTPLGLNMYRWPDDVEFSYSKGKEQLHKYWKECIDEIKDYEQVWTVSFRGKNDHPYWQEDKYAPSTDEGRAAEIGEAINTQIKMIRDVCPNAVICFNMYNEQAEFYKKGLIDLPEDIIRVWPGEGCFEENAKVKTSNGDGSYFHLTGAARNRYTEFWSPMKIFTVMDKFNSVGASSFCLFNVSNLRHLVLSVAAGMDCLWNINKFKQSPEAEGKKWLKKYLENHYGKEILTQMNSVYNDFYKLQCINPIDINSVTYFGYDVTIFEPDRPFMPDLTQNAIMQGFARAIINEKIDDDWITDAKNYKKILKKCCVQLDKITEKTDKISVPKKSEKMFITQVKTQQKILKYSCYALINMCEAIIKKDKKFYVKIALDFEEKIISVLHEAEYEKWATWYETERFSCVFFTRDIVENTLRFLNGEELKPERYVGGFRNWLYFWDKLYEYQHNSNFPLLK